jgi:hypothetical protein
MNAKLGMVSGGRLTDLGAGFFGQTGNAGESFAERGLIFSQEQVHHPVLMPEEIEEMHE